MARADDLKNAGLCEFYVEQTIRLLHNWLFPAAHHLFMIFG